jgi:hypothetical protein
MLDDLGRESCEMAEETNAIVLSKSPRVDELMKTRALNVEIPETVYWHVRRCATESRLSLKEFMATFCRSAKPVEATESESMAAPPDANTTPLR